MDAAGNVSTLVRTFQLTIQTATIATPSTPTLLAADDSGTVGDGVTNVRRPRLVGTAPLGTTVWIIGQGGVTLGSASVGSNGTYSVMPTNPLADGTYSLSVQAVDSVGNRSSLSSSLALRILATPPSSPSAPTLFAADDSGIAGDGITNVNTPRLTGTAPTGTTVQLVDSKGTLLGSTSVASGTTYTVTPSSAFADGTYTLFVRAVDVAGNTSVVSGSLTITILTATPATPSTPTLLPADDSGALGDGITNKTLPHLTGTAAAGTTVQLLNASGAVIGSAIVVGSTYTVTPSSPLADGLYALRTRSFIAAGNISLPSGAFSLRT